MAEDDKQYSPGNEVYEVEVGAPLLPHGMVVRTTTSGKYLRNAMHYALQEARTFNKEVVRRGPSGLEESSEE